MENQTCRKNQMKLCGNENCELCFDRSFANSDNAKYWSNKNDILPIYISKNSGKKFLFDCNNCNHDFLSSPDKINSGYGCPYCSVPVKKLCDNENCDHCFNNSFASSKKAEYWSDTNEKQPREVFFNSTKKFFFDCVICNHLFERPLASMNRETNSKTGCPYCVVPSKILCTDDTCEVCFDKSFASVEKSNYWSPNNEKNPRDVLKNSNDKFYFDCDICKHEFIAMPCSITSKETWCPYCCIPTKLLCDDECDFCFNKSFASHEKSEFWSKDNEKTAREVSKFSPAKVLFNCDTCDHTFECSPYNVAKLESWCSYCENQILCKDANCKDCYDKSFASHEKSQFWSKKNDSEPRNVFKGCANKKYLFDCTDCHHEFENSVSQITGRDIWCSYCSPPRLLCDDNDCKHCFDNSFASHEKSAFWSNKNALTPRQIFKHTNKKYYFKCDDCKNNFKGVPNSIVSVNVWCPKCKFKTEKKLFLWLQKNYNEYIIQKEKIFTWCFYKDSNRFPRFDFFIKELKIIIELDGLQHFSQVLNWDSPETTQKNDIYKIKKVIDKGYTIIRLLQTDVFHDRNDWKKKLKKYIMKEYKKPTCVFICTDGKYEPYLNKLKDKNISIKVVS